MSRAVQEDLSGLTFAERTSKRWGNFKTWVYNSEDGSILGARSAKEWGQLLGYYLVFYLVLGAFTSIFFGVLGYMLPHRPIEETRGICSQDPNAQDACGHGPFFQVQDLAEVGDPKKNQNTDAIFKFGLCEPAFVAIPRALSFNGAKPTEEYNVDLNRKGYQQFTDEVDRVFCQREFNSKYNSCTPEALAKKKKVLPLIPSTPGSTGSPFLAPDNDGFVDIANKLSEEEFTAVKPIYSFGPDNTEEYETYMVFFRFNKVWNYQPYASFETNGQPIEIENNIGVTCRFNKPCVTGTAFNYKNEQVNCDSLTVSVDNNLKLDMLSDVMINYDGFPWRGGALNMNFGSMALTKKKGTPIPEDLNIVCTMGVALEGNAGVAPDGTVVAAGARAIANMDKQGPARAYTRSKGKEITIDLNS